MTRPGIVLLHSASASRPRPCTHTRRPRRALIAAAALLLGLGTLALPAPASAATGLIRHKNGPIAISQDGADVWVVNPDADSVTRIAAGPDTVVTTIAVGRSPRNLAITADGSEVWVTNYESNTVSVIDAATNAVVSTLPTLLGPFGVVFSPDDSKAYVVNQLSDSLLTFDPSARAVIDRDEVGPRSRAVAVTPDGSRVMVQQYIASWLQMKTSFFDEAGGSLLAAAELEIGPIPQGDGGYPGVCQAISVGPDGNTLWIPALDINSRNGEIDYPGQGQLTLYSTMQAIVREVRIDTRQEIAENPTGGRRRLNSAGADVQMPADVAFTANGQFAYLPCSFSNDVLKISAGNNPPSTMVEIPVGDFPNGIVISPLSDRAYVANYLSRDVMVIDTSTDTVIATIPTAAETLSPSLLNGKRLFNTSTGRLSTDSRIACAGCHPEGGQDGANWDFTHFGDGRRNTQNLAGIFATLPLHTIGDRDEVQDFEHNIQVLHFGAGLADGPDNPPVGGPNAGRSQDLDDLAAYVNSIPVRPESPARDPSDQSLSASAAAGKALFESAALGCATCHPAPLFTDNIRHDVGTFEASDNSGYLGFVTPTLRGIYDTRPYLHDGQAGTLQPVVAGLNDNDQHGNTSQLSSQQRDDLIAYLESIVGGLEDVSPPGIEYARAVDATETVVRFLEPVDPLSAADVSNYSIDNGITILSASLDPFSTYMGRDGLTVHLFTTAHAPGVTYTVTVQGVKDLSVNENAIPGPGYTASYSWETEALFAFSNVDSLYTSRLGRDTYMNDVKPDWNFGRSTELRVGMSDAGATRRSMVRFDFFPMLSTVAADSGDIVSAKIRLRLKSQSTTDPVTIRAYRLLNYFVEGSGDEANGQAYTNQTNWYGSREGLLPWGTPGAAARAPGVEGDAESDYLSTNDHAFSAEDSASVSTVGAFYEWDVSRSVRWVFANPYRWNFGHLLVAGSETPGTGKSFYSLDDPDESSRPQLIITLRSDAAVGVAGGEADSRIAFSLAPSRPNPTRGATVFAFALPRAERVTLRLFDASGRSVSTLADRRFAAGRYELAWDGRDGRGRAVAPGIYFYRIEAGAWSDAGRLALIR